MRVKVARLGLIATLSLLVLAGLLAAAGTSRAQSQPRICGSTQSITDSICGGAGPNNSRGACGAGQYCCNSATTPNRCANSVAELHCPLSTNICQMPTLSGCTHAANPTCTNACGTGQYCCQHDGPAPNCDQNIVNLQIFSAGCRLPEANICLVGGVIPTPTPTATPVGPTPTATATPVGPTPTATPSPAPPDNACKDIPNTRLLAVTNAGTQPIWVGGGGAALRAMCAFPNGTSCIPQVFNATSCQCSSTGPQGTLACPGSSVPANGGENCSATGTQNCGPTAAPGGVNNYCYFLLPSKPTRIVGVPGRTPDNWDWELPHGGEADFCLSPASVSFQSQQIPSEVWWSGGVFARTGCLSTAGASGTVCTAGDCAAQPGSNCPAGKGGSNPATIAEFTLQRSQVDFYDMTVINGANVTETMQPAAQPTMPPPTNFPNNYWCKNPGARTSTIAGKDCGWDFATYTGSVPFPGAPANKTALLLNSTRLCDPPPDSRFPACPTGYTCSGKGGVCFKTCSSDGECGNLKCVAASNGHSYCQCQQQSDCSSSAAPNNYCGSEFGPGLGVYLQQCGPFMGWWSADDFCSDPSTVYGGLNCGVLFTDGDGNKTNLSSLFLCAQKGSPPNQGNINNGASCYKESQSGCCGCATSSANPLFTNWPNDATGACAGNNPVWAAQIQPWLVNLKKSCPTAYTYPYDDFTSTYQCQGTGSTNLLGYTITFGDLPVPTFTQLRELEETNPVSGDNSQ